MYGKMRKRFLSILFAFAMALSACVTAIPSEARAEEGVVFSVNSSKTELTRGETFEVTVTMSGNTSAAGLTWDLIYDDSMLDLQSASKGDVLNGQFDMLVEHPANGQYNSIRATVLRVNEAIQDGTIMTVVFKVKDDVKGAVNFDSASEMLTSDYQDVARTTVYDDVYVSVPVTGLAIDKTELSMVKGEVSSLTATVSPADAEAAVSWTSSDNAVAAVDGNGIITAVGSGTAVITASAGGMTAECTVTVTSPLTGISIQAPASTVLKGQTIQLGIAYNPEDTTDDRTVTWASSDPEIVSVDQSTGTVTGVKEGTAVITASTNSVNSETGIPFTAETEITVTENHLTEALAEQIQFENIEILYKGQSIDLTDWWNLDEIIEQNAITDNIVVDWNSQNSDILSVDSDGTATAKKEGTAVVDAALTATAGNGETFVCNVSVEIEVKEIPLESIAFDKVIKEMEVGDMAELTIIYNPENTTDDKTAVWESSDSEVIAVENGHLTALKTGVATITATVGDKTAVCEITVVEKDTTAVSPEGDAGNNDQDNQSGQNSQNEKNIDKENVVQTGDSVHVFGYVVLTLLAAAVVVVVLVKRRMIR